MVRLGCGMSAVQVAGCFWRRDQRGRVVCPLCPPFPEREPPMIIQPYLNFDGRCDEALAFYGKALGAKTEMLMRFKECPDAKAGSIPPSAENKVMHASFRIGSTTL